MIPTLPTQTAVDLLERLATDDAFRDAFQADAAGALAGLGITDLSAVRALAAANVGRLADKRQFKASAERLRREMLDAAYPFNPVNLEMPKHRRPIAA